MEYITPTLTKLYTMADTFTSRASHPRLIVASLSMLECCSFFFPELRSDVWRRTWDCMMLGCREKAVQTGITQAAIASLTLLCPLMLDALPACAPDVHELLDNAALGAEAKETLAGGLMRLSKRRKERSAAGKYGRRGKGALRSDLAIRGAAERLRGADREDRGDGEREPCAGDAGAAGE